MTDLKKWFPFKFNRENDTAFSKQTASDRPQQVARRQQWNDPFSQMEREMDALMRSFFGTGNDWFLPRSRAAGSQSWFGNFAPTRFTPSIDVTNENSHLVVSAELPGMSKDDVEVTFQDGTLTLKGEKRHEFEKDEDGCFRTERYYGSFHRSIPLPADVDANGAEANFNDGVLRVRFPKVEVEEEGPRRIELG